MIPLNLQQDHHVHSTFSDGRGTIAENITAATAARLTRLGCVDHVRIDTTYVPDYVAAVDAARASTDIVLSIGIEAKILDRAGALDLPPSIDGVDIVYAADHQFPWESGPQHPRTVRGWLEDGTATADECLLALADATCAAMERYEHIQLVLAHLFSILPKVSLREDAVPDALILRLATTAAKTGATLEVSERWQCPSLRVVQTFHSAGVPIVASTDAHTTDAIGQYAGYVSGIAAALGSASAS